MAVEAMRCVHVDSDDAFTAAACNLLDHALHLNPGILGEEIPGLEKHDTTCRNNDSSQNNGV